MHWVGIVPACIYFRVVIMLKRFIRVVPLLLFWTLSYGQSITLGDASTDTSGTCDSTATMVATQSASTGNTYTVPSSGTITSWSMAAPAGYPNHGGLVVLRLTGATYTVVAVEDIQMISPGTTAVFPASIAVQAGDVIGNWSNVFTDSPWGYFCMRGGYSASDLAGAAAPGGMTTDPPTVGATFPSPGPVPTYRANIAATFVAAPATTATSVPTLGEWAMLALSALVAIVTIFRRRHLTL